MGARAWPAPFHCLPLRRLLADDGVGRLPQVHLPVRLGDFLVCSERIPARHEENAVSPTAAGSRPRTGPGPWPRTHCCTLQASHISRALLRFLRDFSASLRASWGGRVRPSFLHTVDNTWQICKRNSEGDGQAVRQHSEVPSVDGIFTGLPSPSLSYPNPQAPSARSGALAFPPLSYPNPQAPSARGGALAQLPGRASSWPCGWRKDQVPQPHLPAFSGQLGGATGTEVGTAQGHHLCARSHEWCSWQSCGLPASLTVRSTCITPKFFTTTTERYFTTLLLIPWHILSVLCTKLPQTY